MSPEREEVDRALPTSWYPSPAGENRELNGAHWPEQTAAEHAYDAAAPVTADSRQSPAGDARVDATQGGAINTARRVTRRGPRKGSWSSRVRRTVIAAAVVLVLGGSAVAVHALQRGGAEAQRVEREAIAAEAEQAAADALKDAIIASETLIVSGNTALEASDGKVDASVAGALQSAIDELVTAMASGDREGMTAASKVLITARAAVEQAVTAWDQEVAQAEADRVAAEEEARRAAEAEAARVAEEEAARAAEAARSIDFAGRVSVMGFYLAGASTSTVVADEAAGTCGLLGGYEDVNAGADVTVYSDQGAIVGAGSLSEGHVTFIEHQSGGGYIATCTFSFSMRVPGSDFYQVEVSHRGKVAVTKAEAGAIELTIG